MERDTYKTDVIFRVDNTKDWKGTIFALLPHEVCDYSGNVTSYQHVGQHSGADYRGCIATSKPATPEQYADLKAEMESLGYNFNVIKKQNYDKYLKSYYEVRKK